MPEVYLRVISRAAIRTKALKKLGFDRSYTIPSQNSSRVTCSKCNASVINGIACHELGCPNWSRRKAGRHG